VKIFLICGSQIRHVCLPVRLSTFKNSRTGERNQGVLRFIDTKTDVMDTWHEDRYTLLRSFRKSLTLYELARNFLKRKV
jgi:hypothetical protein